MAIEQLSAAEREDALTDLSNWTLNEDKTEMSRHFKFDDFSETWSFMSRIALIAEKMDHHPEWSNVYNNLSVTLTTHDADGLSKLDIEMARAIDELLE